MAWRLTNQTMLLLGKFHQNVVVLVKECEIRVFRKCYRRDILRFRKWFFKCRFWGVTFFRYRSDSKLYLRNYFSILQTWPANTEQQDDQTQDVFEADIEGLLLFYLQSLSLTDERIYFYLKHPHLRERLNIIMTVFW